MSEITIAPQKAEFVEWNLPASMRWWVIPVCSLLAVLCYQGIIHLSPNNLNWLSDGSFSWSNLLKFMLLDQALVEMITVYVILVGIGRYVKMIGLTPFRIAPRSIFKSFLAIIPLFLVIYFFFAPFTTTIRFMIHHFPHWDQAAYFNSYFFMNKDIYLMYLFPTFLMGYGLLIAGLFLGKREEKLERIEVNQQALIDIPQTLLLKSQAGEKYMPIRDIALITRIDRKYWVKATDGATFTTALSIVALEELLPASQFIRLNRATIIRLDYIDTFSYWENQKYVLRAIDGQEFILSRERMRKVKNRWAHVESQPKPTQK